MIKTFEESKELTIRVLELYKDSIIPVSKLPIDNIVFGKLGDIPLLEMMLNLNVVTKEHIQGTVYDKSKFQMVMRIIGGKLLMRGQDLVERPDAYAWTITKVLKSKNKKEIGFNSTEGALTFVDVVSNIQDQKEKELFTQMLVSLKNNLMLVHTDIEHREGIYVTREMAEAYEGLANSYDIDYPAENAAGVVLTPIKEGDLLILEETSFGMGFYVVGKNEADLTYTAGHIEA